MSSRLQVENQFAPHTDKNLVFFFFFTRVTGPRRSLSLKLSDTKVYEPQIRALLEQVENQFAPHTDKNLVFGDKSFQKLVQYFNRYSSSSALLSLQVLEGP